jgi:hypothetical protein
MKRLACLTLAAVFVMFCFVSCGENDPRNIVKPADAKDENSQSVDSGAETEAKETVNTKGHWEIAEMTVDEGSTREGESSKSVYGVTQNSHTLSFSYDDETDVLGGEHFHGSYVITCTEPPQRIDPGDTVTVKLAAEAIEFTDQTRFQGFSGAVDIQANGTDLAFEGEKGPSTAAGWTFDYDEFIGSMENTYTLKMDEKYTGERLDHFWIIFRTEAGESVWRYDWVSD